MFSGCCLAALLALAALASRHRLAVEAGEGSETNWLVVSVSSLLPDTVCMDTKGPAAPSSSALTVVHRHGPCSPLQSRGGAPSHTEILGRDQARADAIRRKVAAVTAASSSHKGGGVSLLANWGKSLDSYNYITSLRLGTPATELLVEIDTGSVQSWVQCKPCADCYEQHDAVFDPTKSSTYSAIPCGARECQELGSSRNCSSKKKTCPYKVSYNDDSYTVGNLARDTLTLSPTDTFPGFVFGCGHNDNGTFGEVDGLLGLGRGKASLSSQVAATYGAAFSYCLPSSPSAAGYLSFGGAAPANVQFTEMMTGQDPTLYYLNLTGIMVAGRAIKVPPSVFATADGTIIDSGTPFSLLPQSAYAALRSSFRKAMGRYKRAPNSSRSTFFDTCYDLADHDTVQIPSVALVFADGATVHLHPSGVLYTWNVSLTCLAFVANPYEESLAIIGNTQQRTLAVIYDVGNQKIGFGAKGCA